MYAVMNESSVDSIVNLTRPFDFSTDALHKHTPGRSPQQFTRAFLKQQLACKHSFLDFPYASFNACMQYYWRLKKDAPHNTSACIVVPRCKGPWTCHVQSLARIASFPKGSPMYAHPVTGQACGGPLRAVDVYFDPPALDMKLSSFDSDAVPLRMTFPGKNCWSAYLNAGRYGCLKHLHRLLVRPRNWIPCPPRKWLSTLRRRSNE